ncbi:MAG TPA: UpxY family transcription antiterminator [Longimicrobium sp.]
MLDSFDFPGGFDAVPSAPRWYACYTRGRHEKRVAALLEQRGIEHFLPLHASTEQWSDRKKRVLWPLFPSYVFVRVDPRDLTKALAVNGMVAVVRGGSAPVAIPDVEIENVRRFAAAIEAHGLEPELEPCLAVGRRVHVGAGPLRGVEGVVVERRGRARVLVGLQAVGRGMSVEVDAALLQPLDAHAEAGSMRLAA